MTAKERQLRDGWYVFLNPLGLGPREATTARWGDLGRDVRRQLRRRDAAWGWSGPHETREAALAFARGE